MPSTPLTAQMLRKVASAIIKDPIFLTQREQFVGELGLSAADKANLGQYHREHQDVYSVYHRILELFLARSSTASLDDIIRVVHSMGCVNLGERLQTLTNPESIQILSFQANRPVINVPAMTSVLEQIGDRNFICVVTSGALRLGKSFLVTAMSRYIENNFAQNWDEIMDTEASSVFPWKKSYRRETAGVFIRSNPIFIPGRNDEPDVGVIFMDCQGSHDPQTLPGIDASIFAFGVMISSVLLYKVNAPMNENDFEPLILFSREAANHQLRASGQKLGQNFLLLPKDDSNSTPGYYSETSSPPTADANVDTFSHYFRPTGAREEVRALREELLSYFGSVGIFILPKPNDLMTNHGTAQRGGANFKNGVTALMNLVFQRISTNVKQFRDTPITGSGYIEIFQELATAFQSEDVPTIDSLLNSHTRCIFVAKVADIFQEFEAKVESRIQGFPHGMNETILTEILTEEADAAIQKFADDTQNDAPEMKREYQERLSSKLHIKKIHFIQLNLEKCQASEIQQLLLTFQRTKSEVVSTRRNLAATGLSPFATGPTSVTVTSGGSPRTYNAWPINETGYNLTVSKAMVDVSEAEQAFKEAADAYLAPMRFVGQRALAMKAELNEKILDFSNIPLNAYWTSVSLPYCGARQMWGSYYPPEKRTYRVFDNVTYGTASDKKFNELEEKEREYAAHLESIGAFL